VDAATRHIAAGRCGRVTNLGDRLVVVDAPLLGVLLDPRDVVPALNIA
jgi:hypothetical protein